MIQACYMLESVLETKAVETALQSLGAVLEARGLSYGLLVGGGSSLLLICLIDRPTDVLEVFVFSYGV
jgi:hypothetical protein